MLSEPKLLKRVRIKLRNLIKMIPKLGMKRKKRILIMFQKATTLMKDLRSQRTEECCLKLKAIKKKRKMRRMRTKSKKNLNKTKTMRKKIRLNKNLNNQPLFLRLRRKKLSM